MSAEILSTCYRLDVLTNGVWTVLPARLACTHADIHRTLSSTSPSSKSSKFLQSAQYERDPGQGREGYSMDVFPAGLRSECSVC